MPCWKRELRRVLQISKSAHCTMTIDTKKAVWQVYSSCFRASYVYKNGIRLELLCLATYICVNYPYPFLSVRVLEVVDGSGIPHFTDSQKSAWPESAFGHDNAVGEEASRGLHHTNLAVSHRNQPVELRLSYYKLGL